MMINSITFDTSAISGFGITVAIVGYCIVFFALVIMYFAYTGLHKAITVRIKSKLRKEGKHKDAESDLIVSGEVSAAISTALFLYFNELHDIESNVLTIKKISKRYSPWSSKIYSVNDYFKHI